MINVLFVCTGNICRSPTADGVLKRLIKQSGLSNTISVEGAGTHGHHIGQAPDDRAIEIANRYDIDLSDLTARQFVTSDYHDFDYIFAMDKGHLHHIEKKCPKNSTARIELFIPDTDVPDPWYGDISDFEYVFDMIHKRSTEILNLIINEAKLNANAGT